MSLEAHVSSGNIVKLENAGAWEECLKLDDACAEIAQIVSLVLKVANYIMVLCFARCMCIVM